MFNKKKFMVFGVTSAMVASAVVPAVAAEIETETVDTGITDVKNEKVNNNDNKSYVIKDINIETKKPEQEAVLFNESVNSEESTDKTESIYLTSSKSNSDVSNLKDNKREGLVLSAVETKKDLKNKVQVFIPDEFKDKINPQKDGIGADLKTETDEERRSDLEKEFNIELSDEDRWEDKAGQLTPDGDEYTSHDTMKQLGFYGINASRQELIKYALRTDDWQPYRAFSAKETPAYFEIVDGKYEYNKLYYGNLIEGDIRLINQVKQHGAKNLSNVADHVTADMLIDSLKERIKQFNDAPGIVPYVIGLNSRSDFAKEWGVEEPSSDFFDSKWNGIMNTGVFKETKFVEEGSTASNVIEDLEMYLTESNNENIKETVTIN